MDYTYPHIIVPITFTAPMPTTKLFTNLLEPFDLYVWFYLVISIVSLIICLYLLTKIQGIDNKWTVVYNILPPANHSYNKVNIHCKIILCTWTFMRLVLMATFSSCILSLLSVKHVNTLETINALVNAHKNGQVQIYVCNLKPYTDMFKVKLMFITNLNKFLKYTL